VTRSQKLRLKRWIMREIDQSLSRAPFGSAQQCYMTSAEFPAERRDAITQ
jgi:hypothetical protein